MTKLHSRIISILLALIICITFPLSALAAASTADPYAEHGLCITEIALGEVEYTEGANNSNKYGFAGGWCAMFIGWCSEQAGFLDVIPYKTSPEQYYRHFNPLGMYKAISDSYNPQVGDLLFSGGTFSAPDHISITVEVTDTHIISVDGNWGADDEGKVAIVSREKGNNDIVAYVHPNYAADHNRTLQTSSVYHWDKCSTCGYETTHNSHSFTQRYSSYSHWNQCSDCGYQKNLTSHTFTIGSISHSCSKCNYSGAHSCTSWTSITATMHTGSCYICGKSMSESHTMVNSGNRTACSICGYTVVINKVPDEIA